MNLLHFYTDIDECASNPCHSNADCTDTLGSYVCTCRPGFEGDGVDSCLSKWIDLAC